MDNMIFVALMVVSFILINPHLSASTEVKEVAGMTELQVEDPAGSSDDEDEEEEEDEEPSN